MKAIKIHIAGIVQGIGFRPFVYQLAKKLNLKGWIINDSEGLSIVLEGEMSALESALEQLKSNPPELARIQKFSVQDQDVQGFRDFSILKSRSTKRNSVLLTPDYGICEKCEEELFVLNNRRKEYPFITCTHCGPRYSIIEGLPYDRENTSMDSFQMCAECQKEYKNVEDRRYFSQTNSCPDCAIKLLLFQQGKQVFSSEKQLLNYCVEDLANGKILAIKGIGGFLLLCDATNPNVIQKLRERKKRPTKPFALIYPDQGLLEKDVEINEAQRLSMGSEIAPIVLFLLKQNLKSGLKSDLVAPGLSEIGVMRPYAPLLVLLSRQINKPLIATSGNLSGSSIIYNNDDALNGLNGIADSILSHNRDILIPEDDSLMRFSRDSQKKIILRRSRGLAPNYFGRIPNIDKAIFSSGASLKSSFCIHSKDYTYISQYLGDLDSYDAQLNYESTYSQLSNTLKFEPELILCDKHPEYSSTIFSEKLSIKKDIPKIGIQHHEAHFASVLAENNLIKENTGVLGVVWDGTGFGNDENIWGGEFFYYKNFRIARLDHFDYYPHILGNKMPKEPRLSALSILRASEKKEYLKECFSAKEWKVYNKLLNKKASLKTSSLGRVFDAAACLLGLGNKITYEGEAALKLEQLAQKSTSTEFELIKGDWKNPQFLLESIFVEMENGMSKEEIAFRFHLKLVQTILEVADRYNIKKLAFSGGVFQNALLIDLIIKAFEEKKELYFHSELSPNDENISFGQLMHYYISVKRTEFLKGKNKKVENTYV
ncbi:MAG: carbamoyltransferase HypF [Cytophagales bacterium]